MAPVESARTVLSRGSAKIVLLCLLAMVTCGAAVGSVTPAASTGATGGRKLELRIELTKPVFQANEPVSVRIWLTNVSDMEVFLFRTLRPEGLFVLFTATNDTGVTVYQSPQSVMERTAAFVEDTFALAPGYFWGTVLRLGQTAGSEETLRLSPGKYSLKATYSNQDSDGKGGTVTANLESNQVEFRVADPKEKMAP